MKDFLFVKNDHNIIPRNNQIIAAYMGVRWICVKEGWTKNHNHQVNKKFKTRLKCQEFCNNRNWLTTDQDQPLWVVVPDVPGMMLKYHLSFDLQIPAWSKLLKDCSKPIWPKPSKWYSEVFHSAINDNNPLLSFTVLGVLIEKTILNILESASIIDHTGPGTKKPTRKINKQSSPA